MCDRAPSYTLQAVAGTWIDCRACRVMRSWRLGLSAVIEDTNGHKSYWALAHPPGKPDFHHADCFAYELSPAVASMNFGIDQLIAEPALRAPLTASASRCLRIRLRSRKT